MAFPTNPTNNQTYSDGTYTYRYNSTFRTWTKINQTLSNVSNVVTSNSNVTSGNTTMSPNTFAVGNTTISASNVTVGNTTVGVSNITLGNTTVSNGNITVGNSTIGTSNITVGTSTISGNTITVGNTTVSNGNITVGNATITSNTISVGNTTVSNGNISVGNSTITSSNISVGNTTIGSNVISAPTLTGNLASGNTSIVPIANGNIAISVAGTSNVLVVATSGTDITGNANITGNVSASAASFTNQVSVGTGAISVSSGDAGIFNSAISNINLGLAANVTVGSAAGNTTVQGNLVGNNNIYANTGTVSASLFTGTITTNAQPNITSVGTLTNLTVSGNAISNVANANIATLNSIVSKRADISVLTDTVIDSFSSTDYRAAKYVVSSQSDLGYESLEVLLVHNNINSYITVYAAINDGGGNTVNITTAVNSGNIELRATGLASNTKVKLVGTYVPII